MTLSCLSLKPRKDGMSLYHLTDTEIAQHLAFAMKEWRISPRGAALSREAMVRKCGIGLTPLKRFENTGATTLGNLIAMLRALDLLDGLENLIPDPSAHSPLELLEEDRSRAVRKRAPRSKKGTM
jgi:hypothetical protein